MLLIDPIQVKLRMQSILDVGCLEMTKFRRRHTFRWAQVPVKDMFVLYFISQGNVVGISALDQCHTSCFLGLLFSVCVYEPLTPFTLYDARIEIFKKVPFYSSESNLSSGHSKWLIFGTLRCSPSFLPRPTISLSSSASLRFQHSESPAL
jgi:hypothetical protein